MKKFSKGVFALPEISYSNNIPALLRIRYTTRALISNLIKKGYSQIIDETLPNDYQNYTDEELLKSLEDRINLVVKILVKDLDRLATDKDLEIVFNSIQIWGGNQARGFYLKNGGFKNNFNIDSYRNGIKCIIDGKIESAISFFNEMSQIDIAFASKHFSFWSRSAQGLQNEGFRQLPILDNLMFQLTYGKSNPKYRHYIKYLEDIYITCSELEISAHALERQLFNFADTPDGKIWIQDRVM